MSSCVSKYFAAGRAVVILGAGNTALVVIGVAGSILQNNRTSCATYILIAGGCFLVGIVTELFRLNVIANNAIFALYTISLFYVEGVPVGRREHLLTRGAVMRCGTGCPNVGMSGCGFGNEITTQAMLIFLTSSRFDVVIVTERLLRLVKISGVANSANVIDAAADIAVCLYYGFFIIVRSDSLKERGAYLAVLCLRAGGCFDIGGVSRCRECFLDGFNGFVTNGTVDNRHNKSSILTSGFALTDHLGIPRGMPLGKNGDLLAVARRATVVAGVLVNHIAIGCAGGFSFNIYALNLIVFKSGSGFAHSGKLLVANRTVNNFLVASLSDTGCIYYVFIYRSRLGVTECGNFGGRNKHVIAVSANNAFGVSYTLAGGRHRRNGFFGVTELFVDNAIASAAVFVLLAGCRTVGIMPKSFSIGSTAEGAGFCIGAVGIYPNVVSGALKLAALCVVNKRLFANVKRSVTRVGNDGRKIVSFGEIDGAAVGDCGIQE